jgi:hypothetical protein
VPNLIFVSLSLLEPLRISCYHDNGMDNAVEMIIYTHGGRFLSVDEFGVLVAIDEALVVLD